MVFLWEMIPHASGQQCKALACSFLACTTTFYLVGVKPSLRRNHCSET